MGKKFVMKDLLNDQSMNQSGAAEGSGFVVKDIPLSRIKPSPFNRYSLEDIEELAAAIEEMGLLHNLVVLEPDGDGYYELISGERRFRACKLLFEGGNARYETVPCKVDASASPTVTELKLIFANKTARELSDYEKTIQAARIKELFYAMKAEGHKFEGRMRDNVAEVLNVSPAQMGRMESIHKNLIPEILEVFKAEEIGITAAYDLSALSEEQQRAALERYRETGSFAPPPPPKKAAPVPPPLMETAPTPPQIEPSQTQEQAESAPPPSPPATSVPAYVPPTTPAHSPETRQPEEPPTPEGEKAEETPQPAAVPADCRPAPQPEPQTHVHLVDKDGTQTSYSGNLALIAAVDTETDIFAGAFSSADGVTGLDYATLAKAVCVECLSRLEGDELSIDIMRVNLLGLFAPSAEA
jgi:ParB family chromosome partitioning protein